MDADRVLKAARRVTGAAASEEESSEEDQPIAAIKKQHQKKNSKAGAGGPTTVEFGDDDLQHFNADKDKLIKDDMVNASTGATKLTEEAQLIKSLFVTQVEDAYDEFENEKDAQVEG